MRVLSVRDDLGVDDAVPLSRPFDDGVTPEGHPGDPTLFILGYDG
jgi:hypothetical protein